MEEFLWQGIQRSLLQIFSLSRVYRPIFRNVVSLQPQTIESVQNITYVSSIHRCEEFVVALGVYSYIVSSCVICLFLKQTFEVSTVVTEFLTKSFTSVFSRKQSAQPQRKITKLPFKFIYSVPASAPITVNVKTLQCYALKL